MRASLLRHVHSVASKHNPETPTRAVCLVLDHREDYPSEWTAITAVSKRLGMTAQTLRIWSRQQQVDDGERTGSPLLLRGFGRSSAVTPSWNRPSKSQGGKDFFRAVCVDRQSPELLLFQTRDRPTDRLTEPRGCMKPGRLWWKPALNAFAITFADRFPAAETY